MATGSGGVVERRVVPESGGTFTGTVTFPNTGLRITDTGGDHYTTLKQNSNEAANRTLNIPALGADDTVVTLATTQTITALKTIATALGNTDQFIVRNATEGYFFNTSSGLAEIVGYDGSAANNIGLRSGSSGVGGGLVISSATAAFAVPVVVPTYTVAGVPAATTVGQIVYVSNEAGGAVLAFSDGTNWRRVTDRAIIS